MKQMIVFHCTIPPYVFSLRAEPIWTCNWCNTNFMWNSSLYGPNFCSYCGMPRERAYYVGEPK